eukprot:SAG22_NODE_1333_length_4674_cov_5.765319_1_plen_164_part_00
MKLVLFFPMWTYLWLALAFVYFAVVTPYILTSTITEEAVQATTSEFADIDADNLDSLYDGVQDAADVIALQANGTVPDDGNRITLADIDQNQFVKVLFVFHLLGCGNQRSFLPFHCISFVFSAFPCGSTALTRTVASSFLWLSETIKGLGTLTIAGAISTDYW